MTAAAVGLFITKPPSIAEHEVFPSMEVRLNGLKRFGVADVARQTFQSSKLKLGDSEASALENTNGAELFRSKQGIRRGLHTSLSVNGFPSPFRKASFRTLSMDLAENNRRRENTPAFFILNISDFLSERKSTASLAVKSGRPNPSSATSIEARIAPIPVPATRSK